MFDISELINSYDTAVKTEESVEKVLSIAKLEKEVLEERIIYFMEVSGIREMVVDNNKFVIKVDLFPNILVKNYNQLKEYLGEDVGKVFSEKPSKLRSYISKKFDIGDVIPDFIKIFPKESLKVKKGDWLWINQ